MRQPDQLPAYFGHEGMDGLVRIEESLPRALSYFVRQASWALASVEGVVSVPQCEPLRVVSGGRFANYHSVILPSIVSLAMR